MTDKEQLLNELRIERSAPVESGGGGSNSRVLLAACLALALGIGITWWLMRDEATIVVETAQARLVSNISPSSSTVLDATGYVTARRQATVSSKVTGKVVEVFIEEGMTVTEGQLMARLDDSLLSAALELSIAQYEAAKRAIDEIQVQLRGARQNLKRVTELRERSLVSEQDYDATLAAADGLNARLNSAEQNIVVAERSVALQRQQLADMLIKAPFDGVVINKAAQPGEMISPVSAGGGFTRTGIGTIVDMESLEIEVDVNESYINRVQAGQRVSATLNSYPEWNIPAEVITIIPAADRNRATVKVRIRLLEKDPRILPDMGAKVAFLDEAPRQRAAETSDAILVPDSAILRRGDADIVYLVNEGNAEQRMVVATSSNGTQRQITSGLKAGDRVVINIDDSLAQQLDDGTAIRIDN